MNNEALVGHWIKLSRMGPSGKVTSVMGPTCLPGYDLHCHLEFSDGSSGWHDLRHEDYSLLIKIEGGYEV